MQRREELITAVEGAGTQLALSHAAPRRLWRDNIQADPAVVDDIAGQLQRCRTWLQNFIEAYLDTAGR